MSFFNKAGKAIRKTLKGENVVGKVLDGAFDVLPIPNIHDILKKVLQDDSVTIRDGFKMATKELSWVRLGVAILGSYLVVRGMIESDAFVQIIQILFGG